MAEFGELLSKHIERSGISDSELARSVGVGRQTIFRWKEGLVSRPRSREDVLRCAEQLRLTDTERDELLLAAGYRPIADTAAHVSQPEPVAAGEVVGRTEQNVSESPVVSTPRMSILKRWRYLVGVVVGISVIGVVFLVGSGRILPNQWSFRATPTATLPPVRVTIDAPTDRGIADGGATPIPICQHPDDGETLILLAPFQNYAPDVSYNVAGRIQESIEEVLLDADLSNVRVDVLAKPILVRSQADAMNDACQSALIIWGEYDSGRVKVHLTARRELAEEEWERLLDAPSELSPVVNLEVPQEVRALALLTLGRILRGEGAYGPACLLLEQILEDTSAEAEIVASASFYLGFLYEQKPSADLARAIELYSQVIAYEPTWINARYNRGLVNLRQAYAHAHRPDEASRFLMAAIDDLTWTLGMKPDYVQAYVSRGIAYYELADEDALQHAVQDFANALLNDPNSHRAYYNRGLVYIRMGDNALWVDDLLRALELSPEFHPALSALCWGYALDQEPEQALDYCDQAVAVEPEGASRDSRGIVYAQLGRFDEAVADLESYLRWMATQSEAEYVLYNGPLVEEWIEELQAGKFPFTEEVLDSLR